ncbi:MAG: hypothetical protein ACRDDY_12630 [Clostridium sp.]|uniref:hypothetical protein n=1 Tax=Clostridium sp. TaxID=1506 RepID=UPI003EE6223D
MNYEKIALFKSAMNKLRKYNMGVEELRNKLLREPKIKEIMEYLGFKIDGYRNIISIVEDKSIDTPEKIYIDFEIKKF